VNLDRGLQNRNFTSNEVTSASARHVRDSGSSPLWLRDLLPLNGPTHAMGRNFRAFRLPGGASRCLSIGTDIGIPGLFQHGANSGKSKDKRLLGGRAAEAVRDNTYTRSQCATLLACKPGGSCPPGANTVGLYQVARFFLTCVDEPAYPIPGNRNRRGGHVVPTSSQILGISLWPFRTLRRRSWVP